MVKKKTPTAEQIVSTLIDLLADQCGVKVEYEFIDGRLKWEFADEAKEGEENVLHG